MDIPGIQPHKNLRCGKSRNHEINGENRDGVKDNFYLKGAPRKMGARAAHHNARAVRVRVSIRHGLLPNASYTLSEGSDISPLSRAFLTSRGQGLQSSLGEPSKQRRHEMMTYRERMREKTHKERLGKNKERLARERKDRWPETLDGFVRDGECGPRELFSAGTIICFTLLSEEFS